MVNNVRTGKTEAIRGYIGAHPNTTARECADALGFDAKTVMKFCDRMQRNGMLTGVKEPFGSVTRTRYTLGRESKFKPKHKPPPRARERSEYQKARRAVLRATQQAAKPKPPPRPPKPAPVRVVCESVADFVAHGGKIERLETQWREPDRYPRVSLPMTAHVKAR